MELSAAMVLEILFIFQKKYTMKFAPVLAIALFLVTGVGASVQLPSAKTGNEGNKYDTSLINLQLCKKWRLIELNGQALSAMAQPPAKVPFIQFDTQRRVSGNSSCNRFFGTYELNPTDRISFSPMGMTRMACLQDNTIEAGLMQVLSSADSYVVRNDTLVLNRARMAPLARWVSVKAAPLKKRKR
jgi:heat shock protein HslJ